MLRQTWLTLLVGSLASTSSAAQEVLLTVQGQQADSQFGYALGPAGDLDADGRMDFMVGAPFYDATLSDVGQAYVLSGLDGSVLLTFTGSSVEATLGASVFGGRDINGDGTADLSVGAPNCVPSPMFGGGAAYLYSGLDGAELFREEASDETCTQGNIKFGQSVTMLPDFDGDGLDDVAIAQESDTCDFAGTTSVFGWDDAEQAGSPIWSTGCGCWCGVSYGDAVTWGDFNGDGALDVAVGFRGDLFFDNQSRGVYTYLGPDGDLGWTNSIVGNVFGHEWVSAVGDVNGDGKDDVAAAGTFDGELSLRVFSGADGSLLWDVTGMGGTLCRIHDVTGDGVSEILLGNQNDGTNGVDAGAAHILSGVDGALVTSLYGDGAGDLFGASMNDIGDANLDGVSDFAVGAPGGEYARVFAGFELSEPSTYCVGKVSSQGCTPLLTWGGEPTLTGPDNFLVITRDALVGKPGLFFYGTDGRIDVPFLGATLCVQPPLTRTVPTNASGPADCEAGYAFFFSQQLMLEESLSAGDRVNGQYWMRDPQNPDGTGVTLSNALEFTVLP